MSRRKGPAQSGFDVKPFDYAEWKRKEKAKHNEYHARERIRKQLTLPLEGVPTKAICPECGCRVGVKCNRCNSSGFIDRVSLSVTTPVDSSCTHTNEQASIKLECHRCYGVGEIATNDYKIKRCPDCKGKGQI